MMKKFIGITIVFLLSTYLFAQNTDVEETESGNDFEIHANQDITISASWSVAVPMGKIQDYTRYPSGRGVQFDITQNINNRLSFGGNFGWQAFYEKNFEIYSYEHSMITGYQRNYVNAFMLMGSMKYYFPTSANKVKAYLSMEVGVSFIENYQIFGLQEFKELNWHFAITPAMGVEIPATEAVGFIIYLKYPNSFKNNSSIHYSWLNTGVGVFVKILN